MALPGRPDIDAEFLSGLYGRRVELVEQLEKPDPDIPLEERPLYLMRGNRVSVDLAGYSDTHPIVGSLLHSEGSHEGEIAVLRSGTSGEPVDALVMNSTRLIFGLRGSHVMSADFNGVDLGQKPKTTVLEGFSTRELKSFITAVLRPPALH